MANNEIKTNAEIYREQRKARLAKAAKKKRSGKGDKIARVLIKTLCIVLVIGLVGIFAANLIIEVFHVPQKLLPAATYTTTNNVEEEISVAEYNYYYMALYNQAVSVSQEYDSQYGTGAGAMYYFDTTVDPAEQEYTGDDVSDKIKTWADFFKYSAPERAFLIKELYNASQSEEAKKSGFQITAEEQVEMDDAIKSRMDTLQENAKSGNYSLDNYIARVCGEGLTAELYEELLRRDTIAEYYLSWYQTKLTNDISDETVNTYYNEHKDDFDLLTLRFFKVSYAEVEEGVSDDPVYTKEQAKARAEQFKAKVTTEEEFVKTAKEFAPPSLASQYESDSSTLDKTVTKTSAKQLSTDFATWAFDATRKPTDISVFDFADMEAYCVVMIVETAHKDVSAASADVRHLLVQVDTTTTDASGGSVSLKEDELEKNWADAKVEAEKLLKQWKDNGATEEKFIELVKANTDDTASAETGGLYEDITSTSSYVPEFLEWSLKPHKKGDTEIVKTDYGYHIMYYVGGDQTPKWESDVKAAISSTSYNEYFDGIYEKVSSSVQRNNRTINWAAERIEEIIVSSINSAATNSASSYTY